MDLENPSQYQISEWLVDNVTSVLKSGKLSCGLLVQLELCVRSGSFDTRSITDIIGQIESLGRDFEESRLARPFKYMPLKGLWKAHHIQHQFMLQNILREVQRFNSEAFFRPHMGQVLTEELIKQQIHEIVVNSYQKRVREGRATGEWIVFERDAGSNFYLTLAAHDEGDQDIFDRVQAHRLLPFLSGTQQPK